MNYKTFCERFDYIINRMKTIDTESEEYINLGCELGHLIQEHPHFDKIKELEEKVFHKK